jgi:hypothetical protein
MLDNEKPFDARAAVRELALLAPAHRGRKLTFARKCGAYAALYNGVANALVAEEFHLSRASVSALAGCRDDPRTATVINIGEYSETFPSPSLTRRKRPDRKPRYQDVAAEFDRLGADRFLAAYFTPQLHRALIGRVRAIAGADPNASQFAGVFRQNAGIPSMPEVIDRYLIAWHDGAWQYHSCEENGELAATSAWSGEFPEPLRFKTSEEVQTYLLNRP